MDINLFARWQQAQSPFDDIVLYPEKWISLVQVANALHIIVSLLIPRNAAIPLFTLLDWHEHDGWRLNAENTSWDAIKKYIRRLTSPSELVDGELEDYLVYHIFYPQDNSFLLRVDTDNFYEPGGTTQVRFDLSGRRDLLHPIQVELEALFSVKIMCEKAKPYFDKRFRG